MVGLVHVGTWYKDTKGRYGHCRFLSVQCSLFLSQCTEGLLAGSVGDTSKEDGLFVDGLPQKSTGGDDGTQVKAIS